MADHNRRFLPPPALHERSRHPVLHRLLTIGAVPTDTPELRERKRLFVGGTLFALLPVNLFLVLCVVLNQPLNVAVLFAASLVALSLIVLLHHHPGQFVWCVHLGCLLVLLSIGLIALVYGGITQAGAVVAWGSLAPLSALILLDERAGRAWLGGYSVMVVATWLFPRWIPALYPIPSINSALNLVLFTVTIFTIVAYFIRQRDHFQRASDALLRNVLPAVIVERLKQPTPTVVDHVPEASVLFADVVNFTPLAAQLTPDELVQLLNAVFSAFDQLVAHHGLEKIKTIGDCYMVAAGVPTPRPDHAVALVQLALAMQALLATERFHGQQLCFRMGINSGPLVARVIGTHKFLYDLWGDTVNTASRMESHGTGGHIQITATTYALIHDQFICDAQGTITVKGKGELPVWYVRAVRTAANGGHGSTPA